MLHLLLGMLFSVEAMDELILQRASQTLVSLNQSGCYGGQLYAKSKIRWYDHRLSRQVSYHMWKETDVYLNRAKTSSLCDAVRSLAYHFSQFELEKNAPLDPIPEAWWDLKQRQAQAAGEEAYACCLRSEAK